MSQKSKLGVVELLGKIDIHLMRVVETSGFLPERILLLACLRKIVLLIPLILILPHVLPFEPVFSVFLAEPVSDIAAAVITTITFLARFNRILEMR